MFMFMINLNIYYYENTSFSPKNSLTYWIYIFPLEVTGYDIYILSLIYFLRFTPKVSFFSDEYIEVSKGKWILPGWIVSKVHIYEKAIWHYLLTFQTSGDEKSFILLAFFITICKHSWQHGNSLLAGREDYRIWGIFFDINQN